MATQRFISTSFWDDEWICSLSQGEKLLYLYLMTNTLTNIAGVYKISVDRMVFDTGIGKDEVKLAVELFQENGKAIMFRGFMIIPSWPKHQLWTQRGKVKLGIISVLKELPRDILQHLSDVGYAFPLELVDTTIIGKLARLGMSGSQKLRIIKRDGGKCKKCGSKEQLHVHHILAVAKGGNNSDSNLETLCQKCHIALHKEDVPISYKDVRNYSDPDLDQDTDISILSGKPDDASFSWEPLDYLCQKSGHLYHRTASNLSRLKARYRDGYCLEDFKRVIDHKASEWSGKDDFKKYLRPETIFGTKFDTYLAQAGATSSSVEFSRPDIPEGYEDVIAAVRAANQYD